MPQCLRTANVKRHQCWLDYCNKERQQVTGPLNPIPLLAPHPRTILDDARAATQASPLHTAGASLAHSQILEAAFPARVAWFPRGGVHSLNNDSTMASSSMGFGSWGMSGGCRSSNQHFYHHGGASAAACLGNVPRARGGGAAGARPGGAFGKS